MTAETENKDAHAVYSRCVIITAGPLGECPLLRPLLSGSDFIVCADGSADNARALGAQPQAAVGDFDSAPAPEGVEVLRYKSEKDQTDTILAIDYGLSRGFRNFLILGGLSGRLDHTVANFSALMYIYRHGAEGYITDGDNEVRLLLPGKMRLARREGFHVSVFPFGGQAGGVTERGLKYAADGAVLDCGYPIGVSNEFAAPEAEISLTSGALLIILSRERNQNAHSAI
jgi:thiamine pyrophosphokinase